MNPPNPRMHVVNPDEEKKKKSQFWETFQTVALTTLITMGVGGVGYAGWKLASRRFARLMRRQQAEQEAVAASSNPYAAAPGYPVAYAAAAYPGMQPGQPMPQYAYAPQWQQPVWPSAAVREQMPDALREIPTFHAPPVGPMPVQPAAPVAQPQPQVMHAPLGADPTFRKFMQNLDSRFSSIDQRLSQINEQLGDGDDDEDDDKPRGRRGGRGN